MKQILDSIYSGKQNRVTAGIISSLLLTIASLLATACGKVASVEEEGSLAGAVTPLTVTKLKIDNIMVVVPYSQTITIEGGQPPYLYQVTHGALPTGITLNDRTGEIAGTVPATEAGGKASFTVKVTDNLGLTAEQQYTAEIETYTFDIFPEGLPDLAPGFKFDMALTAQGATPPVQWTFSGTLPEGLSLDNAEGHLKTVETGVPVSQQGTEWKFAVIATDANKIQSTREYTLKIAATIPIPKLVIATRSLPDVQAGAMYSTSIAVTGGVSPYTYSLVSGELLAGLALDTATGAITGTVPRTEIGKKASFSVKAVDARGQSDEYPFSITVNPYTFVLAPDTLPDVTPNRSYMFKISAVGAEEPLSFSIVGSLPSGLSIDPATGTISGLVATGPAEYQSQFLDPLRRQERCHGYKDLFGGEYTRQPAFHRSGGGDPGAGNRHSVAAGAGCRSGLFLCGRGFRG